MPSSRYTKEDSSQRLTLSLQKQPSPEQGAEQPSDQPEGTVQDLQDQGTQQQLKEEGAGGEGNAAATVGGERSFLSGNFGDVQIDILGLGELGIGQVLSLSTSPPPQHNLHPFLHLAHSLLTIRFQCRS